MWEWPGAQNFLSRTLQPHRVDLHPLISEEAVLASDLEIQMASFEGFDSLRMKRSPRIQQVPVFAVAGLYIRSPGGKREAGAQLRQL